MIRSLGLLSKTLCVALLAAACSGPMPAPNDRPAEPVTLRVATFNIEDLRSEELTDPANERPRAAAAILQEIRPDIVLINEIAFDQPGTPGWREGDAAGGNGQRFADTFLAVSQGEGLEPLRFSAFAAPSNTGLSSGYDFDNDGRVLEQSPVSEPAPPYGSRPRQTAEERVYGNDGWGFGTFPGQYAMALLVREDLLLEEESVRTFRTLPWSSMPGALEPIDPESGESWYSPEEWSVFRLSSKSHWDVPLELPDGRVLHILASHPTPPAFDAAEMRNVKRNHDEIRFWSDYLDGAGYIVDDEGRSGGIVPGEPFLILGDLNADPDEGSSLDDPIGRYLLDHPRINGDFVPTAAATADHPDFDPDDTSHWAARIDYVLPSVDLQVVGGGVWRPAEGEAQASDHFPVWVDVELPAEQAAGASDE